MADDPSNSDDGSIDSRSSGSLDVPASVGSLDESGVLSSARAVLFESQPSRLFSVSPSADNSFDVVPVGSDGLDSDPDRPSARRGSPGTEEVVLVDVQDPPQLGTTIPGSSLDMADFFAKITTRLSGPDSRSSSPETPSPPSPTESQKALILFASKLPMDEVQELFKDDARLKKTHRRVVRTVTAGEPAAAASSQEPVSSD